MNTRITLAVGSAMILWSGAASAVLPLESNACVATAESRYEEREQLRVRLTDQEFPSARQLAREITAELLADENIPQLVTAPEIELRPFPSPAAQASARPAQPIGATDASARRGPGAMLSGLSSIADGIRKLIRRVTSTD